MQESKYKIFTVENGKEAQKPVKEVKPHLITMDIDMPGGDGFQTINIKSISAIALSANPNEGIIDRCQQVGINVWMVRPIQVDQCKYLI